MSPVSCISNGKMFIVNRRSEEMQKYTCRLCMVESTLEDQSIVPFYAEQGICAMCMGDIYTFLNSSDTLKNDELCLKLNLRKLRRSLQLIECQSEIDQILVRIRDHVYNIERELKHSVQASPSISNTLQEYHSLIRVYS